MTKKEEVLMKQLNSECRAHERTAIRLQKAYEILRNLGYNV